MKRQRISKLLCTAVLLTAAMSVAPGHTAGVTRCDIAATVTLNNTENLLYVNGGAGTISGNFVCEGTTAGASLLSPGSFRFCPHKATGHDINCIATEDATTEDLADTGASIAPVVTDVEGTINIALNTNVSCSMKLNGHSYGVVADLVLNAFKCSDGLGNPVGAEIARADATAAIVIDPTISCTPDPSSGLSACFQTLAFVGQMVAIDES